MEITDCWFCGSKIYPGHGSLYVKNSCETLDFCKSKCKKLYKLGKNPSFLRWCHIFRQKNAKSVVFPKKIPLFSDFIPKIPNNYNDFVSKFVIYTIKRKNRQNVKKSTFFKMMKKKHLINKVV